MKRAAVLIVVLLVTTYAHAQDRLSVQEIERLKEIKQLLREVDGKPLVKTIAELEKNKHPQITLQIREAMARAYADIVNEHGIEGQQKKEWLYSMITLNMAYLQFGGSKDSSSGAKALNKLILQKLRTYLPEDIYQKPGFLNSVG